MCKREASAVRNLRSFLFLPKGIALIAVLVIGIRTQAQTPAQIGDVFVGRCDGAQFDTERGATEVYTPAGQEVNEFDALVGLNMCMASMTFDATGNLYIIGGQVNNQARGLYFC
jgi:hypothetical protein